MVNAFKPSGLVTFWREWVRDPRRVGAIFPSGRSLGRAIAKEVLAGAHGQVVELGAGTGAITRELIDSCGITSLIAIERSSEFASVLRAKFEELTVFICCATEIERIGLKVDQALTVVSSIPFRSLTRAQAYSLTSTIRRIAGVFQGFRFVQYSYFSSPPFVPPAAFRWRKGPIVLANIPPARIWILESEATCGLDV